MSGASPIKQNAILLKNVSREITKLHNEILFIRNDLRCIRDILNMDKDNVKVEIVEDKQSIPSVKPSPMKVDKPLTETELATQKGWFW